MTSKLSLVMASILYLGCFYLGDFSSFFEGWRFGALLTVVFFGPELLVLRPPVFILFEFGLDYY